MRLSSSIAFLLIFGSIVGLAGCKSKDSPNSENQSSSSTDKNNSQNSNDKDTPSSDTKSDPNTDLKAGKKTKIDKNKKTKPQKDQKVTPNKDKKDATKSKPKTTEVQTLQKRAEGFHASYDLAEISGGLAINRSIVAAPHKANFEAQQTKFLKDHTDIRFNTLLGWFDLVFPKYPDPTSPYYLPLIDDQNQPVKHPLDDSVILTKEALRDGVQSLVNKCNLAILSNGSFERNLTYTIKKIIYGISKISDQTKQAQYIKDSVFYIGALGKQCNAGNFTALNLISTAMQKNGLLAHQGVDTLKDHILNSLSEKREEVFNYLCAFLGECYVHPRAFGDVQPQHACNYARRQRHFGTQERVCETLKIDCGFEETAINAQLYPDLFKVLETDEVIRRFFEGKVGDPNGNSPEERRSHHGYTASNAALGLISYFNSDLTASAVEKMLVQEFKNINSVLPDSEVEYWLSIPENRVIIAKTYELVTDPTDEEVAKINQDLESEFSSHAEFLAEIKANILPTQYMFAKTGKPKEALVPTNFGIRQLLLGHKVVFQEI